MPDRFSQRSHTGLNDAEDEFAHAQRTAVGLHHAVDVAQVVSVTSRTQIVAVDVAGVTGAACFGMAIAGMTMPGMGWWPL